MYEIIFTDSNNDNRAIVKQKFNSVANANKWANECEYNYNDIAIDDDGNEYWKTIYRYYNPEDKDNYSSFEVQECTE
jgi:hypothetical protein